MRSFSTLKRVEEELEYSCLQRGNYTTQARRG